MQGEPLTTRAEARETDMIRAGLGCLKLVYYFSASMKLKIDFPTRTRWRTSRLRVWSRGALVPPGTWHMGDTMILKRSYIYVRKMATIGFIKKTKYP